MSTETNKENARRFAAQVSTGRIDPALLSDDFVHWTAISGELDGAGLIAAMEQVGKVFVEPFQIHVDGVVAEGSRVAMEAHSIGETRAGASYRNTYHFLFDFAPDGRIRRINEHMDSAHAIAIMG